MSKKKAFAAEYIRPDSPISMKWAKFYIFPRFFWAVVFFALWIVSAPVWYIFLSIHGAADFVMGFKLLLLIACFILEIIAHTKMRTLKPGWYKLNDILLWVESISGILIFGLHNFIGNGFSAYFNIVRLLVFVVLSGLWLALNKVYFNKRKDVSGTVEKNDISATAEQGDL